LPELVTSGRDDLVFVVEGEKDVDRLRDIGLTATTCAMGAGKWSRVDDTPLHGRRVAVIPDNDDAGRKHASDVAGSLYGHTRDLKIVELPGLEPKGDVSDWLDAGNTRDDLMALVEATPSVDDTSYEGKKGTQAIGLLITNMSTVEPEEVEWLVPGWVPRNKLTMLVGDPGVGKSFLTCQLAANVTTGIWFPFSFERKEPGNVLIISAEDDPADTIRPRLDATGAVVERVSFVEGVVKPGVSHAGLFSLVDHVHYLEDALKADSEIRLVIVDPISAYMGPTDSHKNAEVRGVLAPLSIVASKYKVAVLAVSHLNKGSGGQAVYRTIGSLAFTAGPRAVHFVGKEPGSERRILAPIKLNIGKPPTPRAYLIHDGRIRWDHDPVECSVHDLMGGELSGGESKSALAEAIEFLEEILQHGPMPVKEIKLKGSESGLTWATVKRARYKLKLEVAKEGFAKNAQWKWSLPDEKEPTESSDESAG
ncbi:MAG: AAA family ATPase, partial [Pirellulaceae bacterium]|nr:AAA family ATPase [Pirellulaceae bacterium]